MKRYRDGAIVLVVIALCAEYRCGEREQEADERKGYKWRERAGECVKEHS